MSTLSVTSALHIGNDSRAREQASGAPTVDAAALRRTPVAKRPGFRKRNATF
jgi:hypothetical protein